MHTREQIFILAQNEEVNVFSIYFYQLTQHTFFFSEPDQRWLKIWNLQIAGVYQGKKNQSKLADLHCDCNLQQELISEEFFQHKHSMLEDVHNN